MRRAVLSRFLALKSSHGDIAWHRCKSNHENTDMNCSCGTYELLTKQRAATRPPLSPCSGQADLSSRQPVANKAPTASSTYRRVPGTLKHPCNSIEYYNKICTRWIILEAASNAVSNMCSHALDWRGGCSRGAYACVLHKKRPLRWSCITIIL